MFENRASLDYDGQFSANFQIFNTQYTVFGYGDSEYEVRFTKEKLSTRRGNLVTPYYDLPISGRYYLLLERVFR